MPLKGATGGGMKIKAPAAAIKQTGSSEQKY